MSEAACRSANAHVMGLPVVVPAVQVAGFTSGPGSSVSALAVPEVGANPDPTLKTPLKPAALEPMPMANNSPPATSTCSTLMNDVTACSPMLPAPVAPCGTYRTPLPDVPDELETQYPLPSSVYAEDGKPPTAQSVTAVLVSTVPSTLMRATTRGHAAVTTVLPTAHPRHATVTNAPSPERCISPTRLSAPVEP